MTKKIVSKSEKNTYRYGLQETFCKLYADSESNKVFKHLMKYIIAEDNIVLAYRNICKNKGSFTAGVDRKVITDIPIKSVIAENCRMTVCMRRQC